MASARVIVVGAGPAGAAFAWLLASRGIRVTLLERQTDFAREFRGEVLMPSGLAALRQMGLGTLLDSVPRSLPQRAEFYVDGAPAFGVDLSRLTARGDGPRIVPQPALLEGIVAEAAKLPGFRLERGFTVRDVLRRGERVVGVRGDSAEGPAQREAQLVIGADGRASVVRKRSGLERLSGREAFDVVWVRVPAPDGWPDAVRFYLALGHFCIVFRLPDGRLQLGWVIEKGSFGALRQRGVEAWLDALAGSVSPDLAAHLGDCRDALGHPFLLDVVCDHLREWSAPGVLLLGDAAHPMSPVGAQGINIALRDTLVAANHLAPLLSRGGSALELEAACRRVRDERLPEVRSIQQIQRRAPRFVFQRTPLARFAVRRVAPLLARTGLLDRLAALAGGRLLDGTTPLRLTA